MGSERAASQCIYVYRKKVRINIDDTINLSARKVGEVEGYSLSGLILFAR